MTHPLTDEMILNIASIYRSKPAYPPQSEMRAAYDLGEINGRLTDEESDKYLQMGWTWAIEQVINMWNDFNTEAFDDGEQLIVAFDQKLKALLPQKD